MAQTLRDSLAEFVDKPPGLIAIYSLEPIEERRLAFEFNLGCKVEGPIMVEIPDGHPTVSVTGENLESPEVGKLLMHIEQLKLVMKSDMTHVCIFEESCVFSEGVTVEKIRIFLKDVKNLAARHSIVGSDEFVLFGAEVYTVERPISPIVRATNKFKKPLCYFMNRSMIIRVIGTYEYFLQKNMVVTFDHLFGLVLRSQDKWALCPQDSFVEQDKSTL